MVLVGEEWLSMQGKDMYGYIQSEEGGHLVVVVVVCLVRWVD